LLFITRPLLQSRFSGFDGCNPGFTAAQFRWQFIASKIFAKFNILRGVFTSGPSDDFSYLCFKLRFAMYSMKLVPINSSYHFRSFPSILFLSFLTSPAFYTSLRQPLRAKTLYG